MRNANENPKDRSYPSVIYVTCMGHSGSTILDLVLGSHPEAFSLGEICRLHEDRFNTETQTCVCGAVMHECPLWSEVYRVVEASTGIQYSKIPQQLPLTFGERRRRLPLPGLTESLLVLGNRFLFNVGRLVSPCARRYDRVACSLPVFYKAIHDVTGARVLVDSSKDAARLKLLHLYSTDRLKWIHLVRDGRAVAASYFRRNPQMTMEQAARGWLRRNKYIKTMMRTMPKSGGYFLRYEDFCGDPERFMQEICQFVGLDYRPEMLEFREEPKHNVRGNPMRFRHGEAKIVLDERWRAELSEEHLAVFDRIAGRMNRAYGYSA